MDGEFVYLLDQLREEFGLPLKIISGWRCVQHNRKFGGDERRFHTYGLAADMLCFYSEYRHALLKYIFKMNFSGVGIYKKHIHVDMRRTYRNAVWLENQEMSEFLGEVA